MESRLLTTLKILNFKYDNNLKVFIEKFNEKEVKIKFKLKTLSLPGTALYRYNSRPSSHEILFIMRKNVDMLTWKELALNLF